MAKDVRQIVQQLLLGILVLVVMLIILMFVLQLLDFVETVTWSLVKIAMITTLLMGMVVLQLVCLKLDTHVLDQCHQLV